MLGEHTRFTSGERAAENGQKGGQRTQARIAHKKALRKALQGLMDGVYMADGEKLTGADILALNLFKIAMDAKNKNSVQAVRLILEITGQAASPLTERRLMAEIELLNAKRHEASRPGEELQRLDNILSRLRQEAKET